MSYAGHDHRGEYADQRHDHDGDYAEKYHRHYDLEREDERLQVAIREWGAQLGELRADLTAALERIRALEGQTPQARQLQLEADLAAADLAESGYDREDDPDEPSNRDLEPEPPGWYDVPEPEERGVSEYNREEFALDRGEEP